MFKLLTTFSLGVIFSISSFSYAQAQTDSTGSGRLTGNSQIVKDQILLNSPPPNAAVPTVKAFIKMMADKKASYTREYAKKATKLYFEPTRYCIKEDKNTDGNRYMLTCYNENRTQVYKYCNASVWDCLGHTVSVAIDTYSVTMTDPASCNAYEWNVYTTADRVLSGAGWVASGGGSKGGKSTCGSDG